MIGQRFEHLTVIAFSHYDTHHRKHYLCRCRCGVEKTVQGSLLRSGNTKSCGCWGKQVRRTLTKLPNDGGVINHLILQYQRHARDRGYVFALSRDEFEALVRGACHYCGTVGSNLKITKNCQEGFRHNGIDRVDNTAGYASGNAVSCCAMCNRAKRDMTTEAFLAWARRLSDHQTAMADQWGGQAAEQAA